VFSDSESITFAGWTVHVICGLMCKLDIFIKFYPWRFTRKMRWAGHVAWMGEERK
jgi:hypothetical protein